MILMIPKQVATGKGSTDREFELLTLFLKGGQSCKGKDMSNALWWPYLHISFVSTHLNSFEIPMRILLSVWQAHAQPGVCCFTSQF